LAGSETEKVNEEDNPVTADAALPKEPGDISNSVSADGANAVEIAPPPPPVNEETNSVPSRASPPPVSSAGETHAGAVDKPSARLLATPVSETAAPRLPRSPRVMAIKV